MGYTTEFTGRLNFKEHIDAETKKLIDGLENTRRMKRNVGPEYGIEGEFYISGTGFHGDNREPNIIDYNEPPSTQPSLWLKWRITEDCKGIEWDGREKFKGYIEWLSYLRDKILVPRGIRFAYGQIFWQGENPDDVGVISSSDYDDRIHVRHLEATCKCVL